VPLIFCALESQNIILIVDIWSTPWYAPAIERAAKENWELLVRLQRQIDVG
jgi:hypothetical protein